MDRFNMFNCEENVIISNVIHFFTMDLNTLTILLFEALHRYITMLFMCNDVD